MPAPPKFFFHGAIYFITTSIERDVMLPPNPLIREIILKCLAQAQCLYPIEIIDIIIQPTHVHMLVRIRDPKSAAGFMERFKTESAHAINGLLGRKRSTLWCERYDSPYIPDLETAISKIVYIYTNPSNDGGVDSIRDFPGFNTFHLRESCASESSDFKLVELETYVIPRPRFTKLKSNSHKYYSEYRDNLIKDLETTVVTLSPNALFEKFGIKDATLIRKYNQLIIQKIEQKEELNRVERKQRGVGVIGATRLAGTTIGSAFMPSRSGRRMRVHCVDKAVRIETLFWMRELQEAGRRVREQWRIGDYSDRYPMGLFPPNGFRLAEPLRW